MLADTVMLYQGHPAHGLADHTGVGVYYRAATTEASAIADRRVLVLGGRYSAGQGTLYLARYAKEVQVVVRRDSLQHTMSQYLIDQIAKGSNLQLQPRTEMGRVEDEGRVEQVALVSLGDGSSRSGDFAARFVFTGMRPCNDGLPASAARGSRGFVLTARDLRTAKSSQRIWKEPREP